MPLSRRHVLTGLASAGLSGQIGAAGSIAARRLTPLSLRVGVQLYVIGHAPMPGHAALNKLPDDLATLRRIGFREVEGAPPGLSAKDYRRQLDHAGLACPSIHVGLDPSVMGELSLADMSNTTDYAKIVGARNLVVAVLPMRDMLARRPDASELIGDLKRLSQASTELVKSMSASDWTAIAQRLNEAGAKLSRVGLRLGYHNHNAEFTRLPNGRLAYELLVAETDPKLVDFELDLGWARSAGLDPAALLRNYRGRITQLHFKDLAPTPSNAVSQLNTADMGEGIQNWNSIVDALKSSSVQHIYVEEEPPYRISGMESARKAYRFVQPLLARAGL